jgi:hypothetical protein
MESTTFLFSLSKDTNATIINIQSWFIPLDIICVTSLILAIILAGLFLFIITIDKTCHTVPMMLVANSCLAELIFASNSLGMAVFTLENDLKKSNIKIHFAFFVVI